MNFRISDTFTTSLTRLTGDEQKAVKTTAFDLQLNPVNPGMSFHKLDKARDKNFWSVRVNADLRLIVHKTSGSLLLCYVDHHDKAYAWAERRKLETHPKTGAAQLVEIRQVMQEILVPIYVDASRPAPSTDPVDAPAASSAKPLFASVPDDDLLGFGVPAEWLDDVRGATEANLFAVADHLPQEAAEALLDLATGTVPQARAPAIAPANPFEHPDALRRFRVVNDVEELERALDFPWDKWTVFLHPAQRETVERDFSGPARVSGSAGTGKTVVALHRAVHLARSNPEARVLLTTYSETLANALRTKLRRLIANEPLVAERVEVSALDTVAKRLYERTIGAVKLADRETVRAALQTGGEEAGAQKFSSGFLLSEWEDVVDAWQIGTWEQYRDVARLGRKTRLPEKQRAQLWSVFERVRASLTAHGLMTGADVLARLAAHLDASKKVPFDFVIVDESQDLSVPQLRFLAALGAGQPNRLFFAGDLGQRIFQQPFSWKALGVDIRGRSSTLRINYRTSHQIRRQADRLLGREVRDVDGNEEQRGAISVFNGPPPEVRVFDSEAMEIDAVGGWLAARTAEGMSSDELAVFVRSTGQMERGRSAVAKAGLPSRALDEQLDTRGVGVVVGTMHLAKGMEFRAVAVMACDDEILPLQERIEAVTDDSDLEDVYDTERQLLYVACTRARDRLMVSGVTPASEFLDDIAGQN